MDSSSADAEFSGRDQQQLPSGLSSLPSVDDILDEDEDDFQLLKRALLNERMAPEILQYREHLVDRVKERLSKQDPVIDKMECNKEYDLVRQVLTYERDRVRFLLKAYLRARLDKIEAFAGLLLDSAELRARLSQGEQRFAVDFFVAQGRHFKASVLADMPAHYSCLVKRYEAEPDKRLLDAPDPARFVFARILAECGQVDDGDGDFAELRKEDIMVLKYTTVAPLLADGRACLL